MDFEEMEQSYFNASPGRANRDREEFDREHDRKEENDGKDNALPANRD
jgi:hypothetical protein